MPSSNVQQWRQNVLRLVTVNADGQEYVCSAFLISPMLALTCAHQLLDTCDVAELIMEKKWKKPSQAVLMRYAKSRMKEIFLETEAKRKIPIKQWHFDASCDLGVLELRKAEECDGLRLSDAEISIGDAVTLVGFPTTHQMHRRSWPLTMRTGIVSSMPTLQCGGSDKTKRIQAQLPSLPGDSGAPLLCGETGEVIGIVNGHMTWGKEDVFIPLPLAFATPIDVLRVSLLWKMVTKSTSHHQS